MCIEINMKIFLIFTQCLLLTSCTTEGNSSFLSIGEKQYFLTMKACKEEATSEYDSGGKKYASFECRKKFLGIFLLESKTF